MNSILIIGLEIFALLICVIGLVVGKLYFKSKAKGYAFNFFWWGLWQFPIVALYFINKEWGRYPDEIAGYSVDALAVIIIMLYFSAMSIYTSVGMWKGELKTDFMPESKYVLPVVSTILIVISFYFIFMTDILKY